MTTGFGLNLTYDERNRMTSATAASAPQYYGYAPDNKRIYVYTPSSSSEVWHLYGARGEKIGQFSLTNAYSGTLTPVQTNVWFAGKLVHQSFGAWYTPGQTTQLDRLGSNVGYGAEYYPYGEQISSGYGGTPDVGFASYMHDAFTDLEYADQRYYVSGYGRFTSPDANRSSADVYEPASLNRYSYVSGDPINRNDRSGGIDCWSYYLYLVNTGYSDPDTSQLGDCDGEQGSTSASLDPCAVTDTELSTFLGTDGGDTSCSSAIPPTTPVQPTPAPPPVCTLSLFRRPAKIKGNPGQHSYLYLCESGNDCQIVEGRRDNNKSGPTYGDLLGFVNPPSAKDVLGYDASHVSNPFHDSSIGQTLAIPCGDVTDVDTIVGLYNQTPVAYAFLPNGSTTFNSNSFTYTLLGDIGLSGVFSLPTSLARGFIGQRFFPGWGYTVPNLDWP